MKKLLLINPVSQKSGYLLSPFTKFPPLGLAYVAAVTPSNWEVKIADENFQPFEYEEADIVGISAFTSNINRAYEISRMYRGTKTKVVIGGIHASMLPDEALLNADSVVIAEVEGIWPKLIDDFENNSLSPLYRGPKIDLNSITVKPRRDLLNPDYAWQPIQTSRGCPFDCEFCSVTKYLGKSFRQRKVDDVLDELKGIRGRFLAFFDDNLIGDSKDNRERAINLFRGMVELKMNKKWWMQTSINAASDEEVVKLAAQAGCIIAFIGFETIDSSKLKCMKKVANLKAGVENYKKVVQVFHKYGIGVMGAFIIGNDLETQTYYKKLAKFLVASGIDIAQISILTPLPGTRLMERMVREDRLVYQNFPEDWDKYRLSYLVHRPAGVDIDTVYWGNNYIKNHLYTFPIFPYRLAKSLENLKKLYPFVASYKMNKALKRSWQNAHYYNKNPNNIS